jgi:hypothetical protein
VLANNLPNRSGKRVRILVFSVPNLRTAEKLTVRVPSIPAMPLELRYHLRETFFSRLPQSLPCRENPRSDFCDLAFVYSDFEILDCCGLQEIRSRVGRGIAY